MNDLLLEIIQMQLDSGKVWKFIQKLNLFRKWVCTLQIQYEHVLNDCLFSFHEWHDWIFFIREILPNFQLKRGKNSI